MLLREILSKDATPLSDLSQEDMPYLTSVIYECLRLFPPIGQLINRRAAASCLLGSELVVPEGMHPSSPRQPGAENLTTKQEHILATTVGQRTATPWHGGRIARSSVLRGGERPRKRSTRITVGDGRGANSSRSMAGNAHVLAKSLPCSRCG